ncbi:MAG: PrsW family intramembrane metalloprotease [Bacteroidales bacterium]|nr:PrsW family intramembrane metalloprotease [Bacteroidales bacterium]
MNDTNSLVLLALAVFPVLILAVYIYVKDKYEKEPLHMLLKAFLGGMLSVLPVIPLEKFLSVFAVGGPVFQGLYNGFVVAGFSEELFKLLILFLFIWRSKHFNELFDGIVYAVYVGLGFACVENISYVFMTSSFDTNLLTGITRALFSVPAHFLFAVAMGYYFAKAKFDASRRFHHLFKAFMYPLFLHGMYDSLLMVSGNLQGSPLFYPIAIVLFLLFIRFDVKMWKKGLWKIKMMQERSRISSLDGNQGDAF